MTSDAGSGEGAPHRSGRNDPMSEPQANAEAYLRMYRQMVRIRAFEDVAQAGEGGRKLARPHARRGSRSRAQILE